VTIDLSDEVEEERSDTCQMARMAAACRARKKARSNSFTPSDGEWWYFRPDEEVGTLPVDLILPHVWLDMPRAVTPDCRKSSVTSHIGKALKADCVVLRPGDRALIMDYLAYRDDVFN